MFGYTVCTVVCKIYFVHNNNNNNLLASAAAPLYPVDFPEKANVLRVLNKRTFNKKKPFQF